MQNRKHHHNIKANRKTSPLYKAYKEKHHHNIKAFRKTSPLYKAYNENTTTT